MDDLVQIKCSDGVGVSFLADREIAYSRSEKALYIGDGGRRNQKLCSAETAAKVEALENEKLTATAAEAIAELAEGADLNSVIATVNSVISSLKTSGIMKEG
jgi:hypothetical protein